MPLSFNLMFEQQVTFLKTSNSFPTIIFLSIIILSLIKYLFFNNSRTLNNLPPSPPKLPIIGNLHQIGNLPHRSLQKLSQRYGPIMLLSLGKIPTLVISSPDGAREIMKIHDIVFANRPEFKHYKKLLYNMKDVATAPYGEYWRQLKSILTLQLLSKKRVQSFSNVRIEEIDVMMNKIRDQSQFFTSPVNLSELFKAFTIGVVSRAALGRKYDGGKNGELFRKLIQLANSQNIEDVLPWLAWVNVLNGKNATVDRVARECDEFLERVIEDHLNSLHNRKYDHKVNGEIGADLVDILIETHKDNEAPISLGRDNIKAIILDIIAAGTDTASSTLDWSMVELLRHPRMMKRLQDEVRGIANEKSYVDENDVSRMPYLKAFVKETLRLHPPGPLLVPRKSTRDAKVMGYDIPAGSMAIINFWAIARDPAIWSDPEEFKPGRFLSSSTDLDVHDFTFIPFGYGRRVCPGISFGMAMVELALANIVHQFNWELPVGTKAEDLDMTESAGLAHRKDTIFAIPTPPSSWM